MLAVYPVELAAELETGSRLPTRFNVQFSIFLPNPSAVESRRQCVLGFVQCWEWFKIIWFKIV